MPSQFTVTADWEEELLWEEEELLEDVSEELSDELVEELLEEELLELLAELEELLAGSGVELLRIRNNRIMERVLERAGTEESLDDLDVFEVFERCLAAHEVSEELRPELVETYREAVLSLREDDVRAE